MYRFNVYLRALLSLLVAQARSQRRQRLVEEVVVTGADYNTSDII